MIEILSREALEQREDRDLAGYAMRSADSRGRVHDEDEHPYRGAFQRDRDRIIHCAAFRRLEYKTQVFVNHEGDHYRTRLTHTLEVAQIARSIARALRLNEDLSEALALVHDLGHGPFGHSGEEALREMMVDHGGFEHNQQSLRIVDHLERRYPEFIGLNLTWETRESIVKHETPYDHPSVGEFDELKGALLEAQVVDLADRIAYDNHDLDDCLNAGILEEGALQSLRLWRHASEAVRDRYGKLDSHMRRYQTVRHLINLQVTNLVETTIERLREHQIDSVEAVRGHGSRLVDFSADLAEEQTELEHYLRKNAYKHYRVNRMANKAQRFVKALFEQHVADPRDLPTKYQERLKVEDLYRVVCDYISGMTDRYAQDQYKKLFIPFERM